MYLDIAIGLVIGWMASVWTGEGQIPLILFGIVAALAPDADFIVYLIRHRGKTDQYIHEHRDLFHKPLLFSLGGAFLLSLYDPLYGTVWFFGTLAHFIHDTFDGGWGIRWLHPFSLGYFTLTSYSPKRYFRNRAEQREIAAIHGDPHWLEHQDLSFNTRMMIEFAILVCVAALVTWLMVR